ncbi:MAG: hypothetical protein R3F62_19265 [Planctomycetota bacterium]
MPDDGDRALARMVVEAGFLSQAETATYWNQIQAPGSPRLAQVLLQSGRISQAQMDELRRRFQAQSSSQRRPVTLPVGDATSSQEISIEQAWNEALERDRILAEVLLHHRMVPMEQLRECRQIQRDQQLRLGVVIVKKGYASRAQLETAIEEVRKIGNGRPPWPQQFFDAPAGSGRYAPPPSSGRHPSALHEPPLVAATRESGRAPAYPRANSGHLPRPVESGIPAHGSQRLARDAAAASGSGRLDAPWPPAPPPPSMAKTLEDGDPFASVRNSPGPGDPMFVPLEPEDVAPPGGSLGLPPVVSPQEDGMPTVINRAVKPRDGLPPGLAPNYDEDTVLGGNSLDELNPFANFPMPPGDSGAITIESPDAAAPQPPSSGWGEPQGGGWPGSDQGGNGGWSGNDPSGAGWSGSDQGGWSGSDMDILPSHSESGLGTTGGFAPLPGGGSGLGPGFDGPGSGSDAFKISAQGGGDLPLSESGPSHQIPGFGSGGNRPPIDGGEHSPAPAALVAASASSRERARAQRLDKNTKLLRMLIGLCVGIFVISIALMAYIFLSEQGPPPPQDPQQQEPQGGDEPPPPQDPPPGR